MQVKCKVCKSEFYAKPYHIKKGWGLYCSNKCHFKDSRKRVIKNCYICHKETHKTKSQLRNSKSKKYFCSKSCQTIWRNGFYSGKKHAGWKDGKSSYRDILKRQKVPRSCSRCGLCDQRVLAVHHIDHNRKNNEVANLAWLCHNCHHLIHIDRVEEQKFMVPVVK